MLGCQNALLVKSRDLPEATSLRLWGPCALRLIGTGDRPLGREAGPFLFQGPRFQKRGVTCGQTQLGSYIVKNLPLLSTYCSNVMRVRTVMEVWHVYQVSLSVELTKYARTS